MIEKVISTIEKYNMISPGDTVTVGLSGGADSVCLLEVLASMRGKFGFNLKAAHINHSIRGAEADRDENFVKNLCDKLEIPLTVFHKDIPHEAEITGESEEECGRRIRYECFASLGGKTATAHNLTDSVETTVFNLIRGSALKGVCGIPPVRENIIRPLIECTSEEIRAYCRENGLDFVIDSTNLETDYTRNYIRQEILPRFEKINPAYLRSISRFQASAKIDNAYLDKAAHMFLTRHLDEKGISCDEILRLDDAVRTRVIALFVKDLSGIKIEYRHIELIDKNLHADFEMQISSDFYVQISGGFLRVVRKNIRENEKFSKKLIVGDNTTPMGKITIEISEKENINFNKKDTASLFFCNIDYDKIDKDSLVLRSRMDGDSITLAKRSVTKSLKKLFNEMKIPPEMRDKIPVIADKYGVIWVWGAGYGKKYAVTKDTKKIMTINAEENYA